MISLIPYKWLAVDFDVSVNLCRVLINRCYKRSTAYLLERPFVINEACSGSAVTSDVEVTSLPHGGVVR